MNDQPRFVWTHDEADIASRTTEFYPNGRGVSIIIHRDGMTGPKPFEVAVIVGTAGDWSLDYTTPITNDVMKFLTAGEVLDICDRVRDLPPVQPVATHCMATTQNRRGRTLDV